MGTITEVYVIEDEKYGIREIFSSEKLANAALASYPDRYHISGAGASVIEYDLTTHPESEKVLKMLNKIEKENGT
jgi:hypothetical protein